MTTRVADPVLGEADVGGGVACRKALFLDRDGVINVDHGYVHAPEQTQWVPGIFELCRAARNAGHVLVVATNQAGIARGYYDETQFRAYTRWMHAEFSARGMPLLATYYCPHHPDAGRGKYHVACECRKPKPGMLLKAAECLGIDLSSSVLVGDSTSDIEAASAAGIPLAVMCKGTASAARGGLAAIAKIFR